MDGAGFLARVTSSRQPATRRLYKRRLRGSTPDFCKVYSLAFSSPEDTYKAAGMRQVVLGYILPVEEGEVALRTGQPGFAFASPSMMPPVYESHK